MGNRAPWAAWGRRPHWAIVVLLMAAFSTLTASDALAATATFVADVNPGTAGSNAFGRVELGGVLDRKSVV